MILLLLIYNIWTESSNKTSNRVFMTYLGDQTARSDTVADADHTLVIRVLPSPQVVLVAHVVWFLIDHEAAALHLDGIASGEVGVEVGAVAVAFMRAPLEVSVFVEYDLQDQSSQTHGRTISIFNTVL